MKSDRTQGSINLRHRIVQRAIVEKAGSIGAIIGALACPICFPKIAILGAAVGLEVLAPFEGYVVKSVRALFLIAFIGQLVAFRQLGNRWLLGLSVLTDCDAPPHT